MVSNAWWARTAALSPHLPASLRGGRAFQCSPQSRRDSFARGSLAFGALSPDLPAAGAAVPRTVTSSVVGRHPNGSCANLRIVVSRDLPSQPQRPHH